MGQSAAGRADYRSSSSPSYPTRMSECNLHQAYPACNPRTDISHCGSRKTTGTKSTVPLYGRVSYVAGSPSEWFQQLLLWLIMLGTYGVSAFGSIGDAISGRKTEYQANTLGNGCRRRMRSRRRRRSWAPTLGVLEISALFVILPCCNIPPTAQVAERFISRPVVLGNLTEPDENRLHIAASMTEVPRSALLQ
ncbi:hypothetical protein FN846DRAFT_997347 [Sphaerosporella brunnea]|uniref:Uncharacterized protein n=1 Tax=Sphaerosporella brunnea TaxID=1250544 RepID=A0A5J5EHT1_9PEZI|nr:hypothetical protein FN846DRAFT_997347 [Sphaerosporella brunnea]